MKEVVLIALFEGKILTNEQKKPKGPLKGALLGLGKGPWGKEGRGTSARPQVGQRGLVI
jgi:hypothetical protein